MDCMYKAHLSKTKKPIKKAELVCRGAELGVAHIFLLCGQPPYDLGQSQNPRAQVNRTCLSTNRVPLLKAY